METLTREYEAAMYRFVYNCLSMCIYALLFGAIIYIGDFGLTTDKHFALSLILGFFAGILNEISRKIEFFNRDMLEERRVDDKVEPKFKVGDVIRLKGSAATYTIKKVTDTTYYTDGWSCGIERCEEDYELVEQNAAWSEEDENMLNRLILHFDWAGDYRFNKSDCDAAQDWLKDLKERYTWKPTTGQIKAVEDAIEFLGCTKKVREDLKLLYKQLKKLREA